MNCWFYHINAIKPLSLSTSNSLNTIRCVYAYARLLKYDFNSFVSMRSVYQHYFFRLPIIMSLFGTNSVRVIRFEACQFPSYGLLRQLYQFDTFCYHRISSLRIWNAILYIANYENHGTLLRPLQSSWIVIPIVKKIGYYDIMLEICRKCKYI